MNSKQITFYITELDIELVRIFLEERNCLILARRSKMNSKKEMRIDLKEYRDSGYQFCISNENNVKNIFFEIIKNGEEEYIDVNRSNCIEFSVGGFYPYSNTEFHSSRMYFTNGFFENGEYVKKEEKFTKWASELLTQIRKTFLVKNINFPGEYFSNSFLSLIKDKTVERSKDGSKFIFLE